MRNRKGSLKIVAAILIATTIIGILVNGIYSANDNHYVVDVVKESAVSKDENLQITERIVKDSKQQYFDSKELNYEVELKNITQENVETQVAMVIDSSYSMGINDPENTARAKAKEIASGILKKGESITYTLRLWVNYNADNTAQNKYFASQIRVVGTQANAVTYKEGILNGADPVLSGNLVPVVISDTGVVTKANTSSNWYSYADKKWANSVIL